MLYKTIAEIKSLAQCWAAICSYCEGAPPIHHASFVATGRVSLLADCFGSILQMQIQDIMSRAISIL